MKTVQDRVLLVMLRASVDPLVPDRILITLTKHRVHPADEPESRSTSSVGAASRLVEQWLTEFSAPTDTFSRGRPAS
jgi:hypothetical protein